MTICMKNSRLSIDSRFDIFWLQIDSKNVGNFNVKVDDLTQFLETYKSYFDLLNEILSTMLNYVFEVIKSRLTLMQHVLCLENSDILKKLV